MRTGIKFASFVMAGLVCLGGLSVANASSRNQHKTKAKAKKVTLPPLPSGPLGPVPQLPLDSTPAVAPQVSYQSGQLTILAPNSNLGDILRAVRKQTGAEMEIPANANERVVTQLGPGPAREVIAELLNGSRFNYVLLGSPGDSNVLTRVVLVPKTGGDAAGQNPQNQQQASDQTGIVAAPQPDMANAQPEPPEGEAADENAAEDNPDQNAEAEQPAPPPDQPGVKTPQQMLQEMQQRQLQLQQQQPQGQPPIPGAGYPPPPQRPPEQQ